MLHVDEGLLEDGEILLNNESAPNGLEEGEICVVSSAAVVLSHWGPRTAAQRPLRLLHQVLST